MPALPTGTVTFLFTDIEGSTTLLQRLGDRRYAEVLTEHQRLLRGAFTKGLDDVVVENPEPSLTPARSWRVCGVTSPGCVRSYVDQAPQIARSQIWTGSPSAKRSPWLGVQGGNAGKNHRLAIWKLRDERESTTHSFDVAPQRRNQKVAALFQAGDPVLTNAKSLRDALLRELMSLAQFAQGHFLGNELGSARVDLLSTSRAQFPNFLVQGLHDRPFRFLVLSFSCLMRARCASKRISAFVISRR